MLNITETCLYAKNLENAEHFYSQLMNFELVAKEETRHLFYKCENSMLLIFNPDHTSRHQTDVDGKPIPLHGASGSVHIAFSVDQNRYKEWKSKLNDHGVDIESEVYWSEDARSFYFRDPAGNSLEIITGNIWNLP